MKFISSLLLASLMAVTSAAQPWYAPGTYNAYTNPDPSVQLVDSGDGIYYTKTISGLFPETDYTFKVATEGYAQEAPVGFEQDIKARANSAGEISINFWDDTTWDDGWMPNNARRVGYVDHNLFDWEIFGDDIVTPLALTDQGSGLHTGTFAFDAGFYGFKFRGQGTDTTIGNNGFSNNAGDNSFRVWTDGDPWNFELDLPNGRWRAYTTAPTPDYNNDQMVDASDYVVWRKNDGSEAGYNVWRANYGFGTGPIPWYVRGSFNSFGLDHQMVDQGGGHYTATVTGLDPGSDHEYKVANADFSTAFPGSNGKVRADASGEIDFHFYLLEDESWNDGWSPTNVSRVGYEDHNQYDWELMGTPNTPDWTGGAAWFLTDMGNGLHTGTFVIDTAGNHEFKFRQQGDWNTSIGADFGNSAPNATFTTTTANELWHFELDLPNGRWRAYLDGTGSGGAVPEPASILFVVIAGFAICGVARRR